MRLLTNLAYTAFILVGGTIALGMDLVVGVIIETKHGFREIWKAIRECWQR